MGKSVTVYRFEYFDRVARAFKVADDYATEQAIESMGAVILRESALEVEEGRIASSGLVMRDPA